MTNPQEIRFQIEVAFERKTFKKESYSTETVITPKLTTTLDSIKMSDRKATFVIAEKAQSFRQCIDDFNINGSEKYRA